jgi:glucuronokinase
LISNIAYPRAALFGNPSDGFFGKTIAFPFREFQAEVSLIPMIHGIRLQGENHLYPDLASFYESVQEVSNKSLLQATLKRFLDHCHANQVTVTGSGFEIRFQSNIPLQVGMAGSSAIITATWRVLMQHFGLDLPPHLLANQVLEVETLEMGIGAGLQDRVVQAYGRPVYMDFNQDLMTSQGYGDYHPIPESCFQNLYIAYMDGAPEGSEVIHNNLRSRYDAGELAVHETMRQLSQLTIDGRIALENEEHCMNLGSLIDQNFDLRRSICDIAPAHLKMVQIARKQGASAKFTGSGGTIIGQFTSEEMYNRLQQTFSEQQTHIFKPTIVNKA